MLPMLFGERCLTKVAALFDQAIDARTAAERVIRVGRLPLKRVLVVGPADPAFARKLEADDWGAFSMPIKSHVGLGTAGLLLGLLSGGALTLIGVGFAEASPYYTVAAAGTFGMFVGLMLGGPVALRPDHAMLIAQVRDGLGKGRWAVVVHPISRDQESRARNVLEHCGGQVIQSL